MAETSYVGDQRFCNISKQMPTSEMNIISLRKLQHSSYKNELTNVWIESYVNMGRSRKLPYKQC